MRGSDYIGREWRAFADVDSRSESSAIAEEAEQTRSDRAADDRSGLVLICPPLSYFARCIEKTNMPSMPLVSPLHDTDTRRQVAMRKMDDAKMSALRRQSDSLVVSEQLKEQAHRVPVVVVLPSRCLLYLGL